MSWSKNLVALSMMLGFFSSAFGIVGPIDGPIPANHPGSYNTIALIKDLGGGQYKVFCTGFIFNSQTIVSAKHCVAGKSASEFKVYLGPDTNSLRPELVMDIESYSVYGSADWQSYFPSFDVSAIRLKTPIPGFGDPKANPYFDRVEFLNDSSLLKDAEKIHLVGYGNQSPEINTIIAGEKKHVATGFYQYVDTPQLSSLVVFRGELGHSNCHGDSGGPAYAYVADPSTGVKSWYVVGTAAGFDLALTPSAYQRTADEDFPLIAHCDQSQTIYSFIGDYLSWIEEIGKSTEGEGLGLKRSLPPGDFAKTSDPEGSFSWYCNNTSWRDSNWGAVRELIILAAERPSSHTSDEIYVNCTIAGQLLEEVSEIELGETAFIESLEPFGSLPRLHTLKIKKQEIPDFSRLDSPSLERLELSQIEGVTDLSFLQSWPGARSLKAFAMTNSKLTGSKGISQLKEVQELNLSFNELETVAGLKELTDLKKLDVSANRLRNLDQAKTLKKIEELVIHSNELESLPNLSELRVLNAAKNNLNDVDFLSEAYHLEVLDISENDISGLEPLRAHSQIRYVNITANPSVLYPLSGVWLKSLKELRANGTELSDLEFLKQSYNLEKLYAANSQITDLSEIAQLPELTTLFIGGTPLATGHMITEKNCPKMATNAVGKFCASK